MNEDSLLFSLCETQIEAALEETLMHCERYQKVEHEMEKEEEYLFKLNLTTEQLLVVERVISSNNYCGMEYGRVAYHQGFQDGIKLMAEILDIIQKPSNISYSNSMKEKL